MESVIDQAPPLIQVLLLAGLGAYVAVSIAARLVPAFGARVWDPHRRPSSGSHLVEYTVIPAIVFIAATAVVLSEWDSARPWLGSWTVAQTIVRVGLSFYALGAIILASILNRRMDTSDARRASSWLPFGLVVSAIGAIVVVILR